MGTLLLNPFLTGARQAGEPRRQTRTSLCGYGSPQLCQGGPDAWFGGLGERRRNQTLGNATQPTWLRTWLWGPGTTPDLRSIRANPRSERRTQQRRLRLDHRVVNCGQTQHNTGQDNAATGNTGTHTHLTDVHIVFQAGLYKQP